MPKITIIPPIKPTKKIIKNVAGYARISTAQEVQQHSLNAQINYLKEYIAKREGWNLVDIYAEQHSAISKNRPEFLRMINDARNGKIDLILMKSVDRFARNTEDALSIYYEMRRRNVEIRFLDNGISNMYEDDDLRFMLLSDQAEEFSRIQSRNLKWSMRQSMLLGHVINRDYYGYKKINKSKYEIKEDEARIIKRIFTLYNGGLGAETVAKVLNIEKIKPPKGVKKWKYYNIRSVLSDEKYVGDYVRPKTFARDMLSRRQRNNGEIPVVHHGDIFPKIVSQEMFDKAQERRKKRSREQK